MAATEASARQMLQPTEWLQRKPKPEENDLTLQFYQRRQGRTSGGQNLADHKKQRQETARACKRQRREGDGRFPQEGVKTKLRQLQERGEVRPEPAPAPKDAVAEACQRLHALENCQTCIKRQWTREMTKGFKACLGQFWNKLRLTRYGLEHQRQVVRDLTSPSSSTVGV